MLCFKTVGNPLIVIKFMPCHLETLLKLDALSLTVRSKWVRILVAERDVAIGSKLGGALN